MTDERKQALLAVKHIMKPLPEGKQRADKEAVKKAQKEGDYE